MYSLCILKHRENLAPYDRPTNKEQRRALINNVLLPFGSEMRTQKQDLSDKN